MTILQRLRATGTAIVLLPCGACATLSSTVPAEPTPISTEGPHQGPLALPTAPPASAIPAPDAQDAAPRVPHRFHAQADRSLPEATPEVSPHPLAWRNDEDLPPRGVRPNQVIVIGYSYEAPRQYVPYAVPPQPGTPVYAPTAAAPAYAPTAPGPACARPQPRTVGTGYGFRHYGPGIAPQTPLTFAPPYSGQLTGVYPTAWGAPAPVNALGTMYGDR